MIQQHCEAYYYAGMVRLCREDVTKAMEYFESCLETGVTDFYEYQRAQAELTRMGR